MHTKAGVNSSIHEVRRVGDKGEAAEINAKLKAAREAKEAKAAAARAKKLWGGANQGMSAGTLAALKSRVTSRVSTARNSMRASVSGSAQDDNSRTTKSGGLGGWRNTIRGLADSRKTESRKTESRKTARGESRKTTTGRLSLGIKVGRKSTRGSTLST